MAGAILTLNAGSSSLKFALFEPEEPGALVLLAKGAITGIGTAPSFAVRDRRGAPLVAPHPMGEAGASRAALLARLLEWIEGRPGAQALLAVGHRVVHGGRAFRGPTRLVPEVVRALDRLTPLAPLHQPISLAPIKAIQAFRPELPQVACFDTAFHEHLSVLATRFALPRAYEEEGVRRYGFHGLSYEYIAGYLREHHPALARGRVIVAHLGSGASLCAMRGGESVDTTMGLTALDGLVMGTRPGALDPGVVLYMLQQEHLPAAEIEAVLYRRSGLLGVSGISSDMHVLLASADPRAREAVDLFVYRIAREAAALAGSLGGLDGFVFTAGIGENAAEVRAEVCARLAWLGVVLDREANARGGPWITQPESRVRVLVIPTDEEVVIARHTWRLLRAPAP